jgi:hypothetical protein
LNTDEALATAGDADTLQELKEAVADAHLEFIRRWVSGEGARGRVVLGARPSSRLASGFILPRVNPDNDDEASDIRIPSHGLDIAVRPGATGAIDLKIEVAIYLRVLPEAAELFADDGLLLPPADYSARVKREMREQRKRLRSERIRPEMTRAEKQATIDAIAREIEARYEVEVPAAAPAPGLGGGEEQGEDGVVPLLAGIARRRRIPSRHSRAYEVPSAFIRLQVPPVSAHLALPPGPEWQDEAEATRERLQDAITSACSVWLESEEGRRRAWRPEPLPVSEDFWSYEAWDGYLSRARDHNPDLAKLRPDFEVRLRFDALPMRAEPGAHSIRIALENEREQDYDREYGLFGVALTLSMPSAALLPASLERVRRSYHLEGFLEVPAIGLNCGVDRVDGSPDRAEFRTTWMPRYVLPRTEHTGSGAVETRFASLAEQSFDPAVLTALPDAMQTWVEGLRRAGPPGSAEGAHAEHWRDDLSAWEREAARIRLGINLLVQSRASPHGSLAASPWEAWLAMQETFARLYRPTARIPEPGWRLFQLAFVLSHVPTLASRVPGFDGPEFFRPEFDEDAATLLYMSTGGGKTEAFFGTVVYAAFLDRLRGKDRGVTAMMHYPLRLLTVQQAQRLARTLACAEMIRAERMSGAPFEIGFWVGGGNTPNAVERVCTDRNGEPTGRAVLDALTPIPLVGTPRAADEAALMAQNAAAPEDRLYQAAQVAWNKLPTCPFCSTDGTGLRLFPEQHHRLGIVCHAESCPWNRRYGGPACEPLPFLLTDADIYRRAPTVLLGTIDKLALIGQDIGRIGQIGGMFGLARRVSDDRHGMLEMGEPIAGDPPSLETAPSHQGGREVFVDPFPSLIIQDEMHLLDESLGTFGGLFETSLFEWFRSMGDILGHRAVRYAAAPDRVRLPHIIGATATASDVRRHVQAIYQRNVVQFPHPGPGLHEGFYVRLKGWAGAAGRARAGLRGTPEGDEAAAPWARVYASLMTNGRRHTVTTLAVLAAHAAASTRWLTDLRDPATRAVAAEEIAAHQSCARFSERRAASVRAAAAAGLWDALLTLVDLHRINLTYVTNKKGGDQILSALGDEVREAHRLMGGRYSLDHPTEGMRFGTALISGGVDVGTIQEVVKLAEREILYPHERVRFDPSGHEPFRGLRAIVATSAVSHGVDVETFNAMTFAGLPSDIAEYIQASSRVGRTHVGFSLLVPTPQTRRDRYVVEVHEPFHRLLERMIPPPAAERWAERAIERAIPSIIQTWLGGVYHQAEYSATERKQGVRAPNYTTAVSSILDQSAEFDRCVAYIARSFGVRRPRSVGGAHNPDFYERVIRLKLRAFLQGTKGARAPLRDLWEDGMVDGLHKPMTSLRDVDGQGVVRPARYLGRQELNMTKVLKGLNAIRSGAAGRIPRGSELEEDGAFAAGAHRPRRTAGPPSAGRSPAHQTGRRGRAAR